MQLEDLGLNGYDIEEIQEDWNNLFVCIFLIEEKINFFLEKYEIGVKNRQRLYELVLGKNIWIGLSLWRYFFEDKELFCEFFVGSDLIKNFRGYFQGNVIELLKKVREVDRGVFEGFCERVGIEINREDVLGEFRMLERSRNLNLEDYIMMVPYVDFNCLTEEEKMKMVKNYPNLEKIEYFHIKTINYNIT